MAVLLNALVMPGSGHIYLGKKLKGYLLGITTLVVLFTPIVRYTMTVVEGLKKLTLEDNQAISGIGLISNAWAINKSLILYCLAGLGVAWIYGILDIIIERR